MSFCICVALWRFVGKPVVRDAFFKRAVFGAVGVNIESDVHSG